MPQGRQAASPVLLREYGTAAQRQPQQDGAEEDHERVGRPDGRQSLGADKLPHDEGVGYVVALLQQGSRHHGEGKPEQGAGNASLGKVQVLV